MMAHLALAVLSFAGARVAPRAPVSRLAAGRVRMATFDYDLAIIGCGVGGHGAALHAVSKGLKTVIFTGGDAGGTCVNRGCVPSKALLAASGRVREMRDDAHLKSLGISVNGVVEYDRAAIANHANGLASRVKGNLVNSLVALGVDMIEAKGALVKGGQKVQCVGQDRVVTAKDIIIATGSVPFVPRGIEIDGKTVFTCALRRGPPACLARHCHATHACSPLQRQTCIPRPAAGDAADLHRAAAPPTRTRTRSRTR